MPAWIHNRAERILSKNPEMDKGEAFAIATQQAHALGKTPSGYGTSAGRREAKAKYRTPSDDQKTASVMWSAFFSELEKEGMAIPKLPTFKPLASTIPTMPKMPRIPGRVGSTRLTPHAPPATPGHMPQAPAPATSTISTVPGSTTASTARSVGGSGGM